MELIIQRDKDAAALLVARIVAHEIRTNPRAVLGLATGSTMEAVYQHLVRMHREAKLDFSGIRTFNLDEYVGLSPDDPNSYRHFMNKHLFKQVNIDLRNTHLPNGRAADLGAECRHYEQLITEAGGIDLQLPGIRTFNLDEYVGLSPDDPNSYRHFMNEHLFRHVNIDLRNTHLPNGRAADLGAECRNYEKLMADAGGIDLQLLGIGKSGHIGFNEPLSALKSRTREKALTPTTIKQNAPFFGGEDKMPRRAITMGVGTILDARRCLLLATGEAKADIIAQAVEGPITSMVTASALQLHAKATVIVDEAAAARLKEREYYRWIFANEPEWEEYR